MDAADEFSVEFSTEKLLEIYKSHIAQTSAIGIDRLGRTQFEQQLSRQISVLAQKTNAGIYRFTQYREKLISKGAKKLPRVISIPTFRDRIALRSLCNILRTKFETELSLKIPQVVVCEIKEAIRTGKFTHFAKLDIQEFYPSVQHNALLNRLQAKINDARLLKLITAAIENPTVSFPNKDVAPNKKGVPQGLAVSNILAEIYLAPFDRNYGTRNEIRYFRYVDDILVLSKGVTSTLVEEMRTRLRDEFDLSAHPLEPGGTKTVCGPITDTFHFLGYEFKDQKCRAKDESIKRLEDSVADIFTTYKYKIGNVQAQSLDNISRQNKLKVARNILMWRLNLRVTGCLFEGTRKGWVFYFSQIDNNNLEQLWRLDRTVENLLQRFALPSDCQAKSFVRTFYETKRRTQTAASYIPNFDTTSLKEQRVILASYFGLSNLDGWTDSEIQSEFAKRMRRATRELELDIQDLS